MDALQRFKIPGCILAVALCVLLGVMMWQDRQEETAQEEELARKVEEAQTYQDEIDEIEQELSEMYASISQEREYARIMIGFRLSDVEDAQWIAALSEEYDFTPVIVLDCTDEAEDLENYADSVAELAASIYGNSADGSDEDADVDSAAVLDWEYMLTGTPFSDELHENILSMRSYLEENGQADCGVFLLRKDDNSSSNRQLLKEDGFEGYTMYSDIPVDGISEETDMLYFSYCYVQSYSSSLDTHVEYLCESKSAMIIAFDMGSVHDGDMTEADIRTALDAIYSYVEEGELMVSSVSDTMDVVVEIAESESERQAEYDEYEAQQQARVEELEALIQSVYAD